MNQVVEKGKKWAELAQLLRRTEHMTKNRYYSLITKQKRVTPNIRREEDLLAIILERLSAPLEVAQDEAQGSLLAIKAEEGQEMQRVKPEVVRVKRGRPPKPKS